jgi:hypothetical protein
MGGEFAVEVGAKPVVEVAVEQVALAVVGNGIAFGQLFSCWSGFCRKRLPRLIAPSGKPDKSCESMAEPSTAQSASPVS